MTADNKGFTTEEIIIKNIILAKDYDVAYNYVQILKDQLRRDAVEEYCKSLDRLGIAIARATTNKVTNESLSEREKRIFQDGLSQGHSLASDNNYTIKIQEAKKELLDEIAKSHQFTCLESWCKTRWFNVSNNNYGEKRDEYCYNCKAINELRAKTLGENK